MKKIFNQETNEYINLQNLILINSMSHISLNRKRHSQQSNIRSRMVTQAPVTQQKQNFNIDQNIQQNLNSIKDTLAMLKQYQKLCIQKQDFIMAEQTKNKIQYLQQQHKVIEKERDVLKEQQNIEIVCKGGQQEVQKFQQYWDQTIKSLVQELKQIQANFVTQQATQLEQYRQKVANEQGPKVKYSPKVLQLRKNLTNLIKMRKYKEADEVKNKLKTLQVECEQQWQIKIQDHQKILVQKLEKKQSFELKALRAKLETIFNEKIKERDQKFQILLKRNRKRRIQSSKSKVKSMNQSVYKRSKSQSRVVLGNSNMSSFNCSASKN